MRTAEEEIGDDVDREFVALLERAIFEQWKKRRLAELAEEAKGQMRAREKFLGLEDEE